MAMLRVSFGPSADARDSAPLALRCARPSHRPKNLAEISRYLTTLIGAGAPSLVLIVADNDKHELPQPSSKQKTPSNVCGCRKQSPCARQVKRTPAPLQSPRPAG